jgi:predicted aspartyl protease
MSRRFVHCLAASGLALLMLSGVAYAQSCELKQIGSLDFQKGEGGGVVVPVTIAGRDAKMKLDTGAFHSHLNEDFAQDLEGERRTLTLASGFYFTDAAGEELRRYIKVKSVGIGAFKSGQSADFLISSRRLGGDGLLGLNILKNFDVEIDFAKEKVIFYLPNDCKSPVHWAKEWVELPFSKRFRHPLIKVNVDGKMVTALVDTGADVTVIADKTAESLLGKGEALGQARALLAISGETISARKARFKSLSVQGIAIYDPEIYVSQFPKRDTFQMVLGLDKLKALHLYFAFEQDKLFATAADVGQPK